MSEAKMVYSGILKAQKHLCRVGVSKGLNVPAGGKSYKARGIDGVMNAVSTALDLAGIFVVPNYETISREIITTSTQYGDKIAEKVVIRGTFYFMAEDGSQSQASQFECSAINSSDKGAQIAMSYCIKYFFAQALSIPFDGVQEEGETQNIEIAENSAKLPIITDVDFKAKFLKIERAIADGKTSGDIIYAMNSKYRLSHKQEQEIIRLENEFTNSKGE